MTRQPDGPGKRIGKKGEISGIGKVAPGGAKLFRERLPQIQAEAGYWETRAGRHGPGRGKDAAPERSRQRTARCCDVTANVRMKENIMRAALFAAAINIGATSV